MPRKSAKMPDVPRPAWDDVATLLAVVQTGDVQLASSQLGIDPTTVARRVRRLETQLGHRLLIHKGGRLVASEAAADAIGHCEVMQREAVAFTRAVMGVAEAATGVVRVTAIRAILNSILIPTVSRLVAKHPKLILEMIGDARNLSISRGEADIAVRLAMPTGPDVVTRKLADIAYSVYAAASKASETDITRGPWIAYDDGLAHVPEAQWLNKTARSGSIVLRVNGIAGLTAAARAGIGLAVLPRFVGDAQRDLVRLSGQEAVVTRSAWLVAHRELRTSLRVRAVIDWIVEAFAADLPRLEGTPPKQARRSRRR